MAIVNAQYIGNQGVTGQELLGNYLQGVQKYQTDWMNDANRRLQIFDADESTRWGILKKLGDQANPMTIKEALAPEYENFLAALRAQNKATGNRQSEAELQAYAENYFSRYYNWKPGDPVPGEETPATAKRDTPEQKGKGTAPTPPAQGGSSPVEQPTVPTAGVVPQQSGPIGDYNIANFYDPAVGGTQGIRTRAPTAAVTVTPDKISESDYVAASVDPEGSRGEIGMGQSYGSVAEKLLKEKQKTFAGWTGDDLKRLYSQPDVDAITRQAAYEAYRALEAYSGTAGVGTATYRPDLVSPAPASTTAPRAKPMPEDAASSSVAGGEYTVLDGENLWSIASKLAKEKGIDVGTLWTALKKEYGTKTLQPGDKIKIPGFASGAAVGGPTLALIGEGGEREYVVPESKVPMWAQMALSNPRSIPNPRDIPRMAEGDVVDPNAIDGATPQTLSPRGQLPPPPQPLPTSGDSPLNAAHALAPTATPALSQRLTLAKKQLEEAMGPGDDIRSKIQGMASLGERSSAKLEKRIEDVVQSKKHRAAANAMALAKGDPAFKQIKGELTSGFAQWFDQATPEELALFRGMEGAAQYRDSSANRAMQKEIASGELALKQKYYDLQAKAAEGDQTAVTMQLLADYAMKLLEVNKGVIEEKGMAKAAQDDPNLLQAWNFVGSLFSLGDKPVQYEVIKRFLRAPQFVEAKGGDKAGGMPSPDAGLVKKLDYRTYQATTGGK